MSLSPISQKAHDIAYAVFRCAAIVKNSKLRAELESAAIDLVSDLNLLLPANYQLPVSPADKLERLISLAESVNEMKTVNAQVLRRELGNIQTAIHIHLSRSSGNAEKSDLDITNMFLPQEAGKNSGKDAILPDKIAASGYSAANKTANADSNASSLPRIDHSKHKINNAEIRGKIFHQIHKRHDIILRLIRETPFCRLKTIKDALPDASERTIRNDIQSLIEVNQVRRVGSGGPNSYFESLEVSIPPKTYPLQTTN